MLEPFLRDVIACNAADATARGMAGTREMRDAIRVATQRYLDQNPDDEPVPLLRFLRDECLGPPDKPIAPGRPATPPWSALTNEPPDVPTVSTIVTIGTLLRLMSDEDKQRFEGDWSVRFNVSGATRGADFDDRFERMLVRRLASVPGDSRMFRIAPDQSHGRPYLWFTPKADFDHALAARRGNGFTDADNARDFLGLVHHGTVDRDTGGPNILVALHFPAAIVAAAGHMRPAVPQAFDNRRFVLSFNASPPPTPGRWGHTLDLDHFARSLSASPAGGRERVLLRIQASLFDEDTRIGFDVLNRVEKLRGDVAGRDDDGAFVDFVSRGRDVAALVEDLSQ